MKKWLSLQTWKKYENLDCLYTMDRMGVCGRTKGACVTKIGKNIFIAECAILENFAIFEKNANIGQKCAKH